MFERSPWSRRQFLGNGGLIIAAVALTPSLLEACGSPNPAATGPGKLVYAGYGGSYNTKVTQVWWTPFQSATGIDVTVTPGAEAIAQMSEMVKANATQWDVVNAFGPTFGQMISLGLLEKLDYSVIDTSDLASPDYKNPYGVAFDLYSHNIFWNTKAFAGPLLSWADVWDVKRFPGKRGFQKVPYFTLEVALVADGVPIHSIYPLDLDRAFRSLDKIKPHAVFSDLNSLNNLVAQQEVVTGDLNLSRVQTAIKDGVPLQYNWHQAMVDAEELVVLKGAPDKANAMKAVAFTLKPETQLKMVEILNYAPTVKKAIAGLTASQRADLPGTPETQNDSFLLNSDWWAKNGSTAQSRFEQWLAG